MIYKCKSNAKINISLRIVGKKNGFHLLNSVFIPIDLSDDMEFCESDIIEIDGFNFPMGKNIIYKTITLIKKKYNINKGVKVICNKKIPMGAGLGGGSSNAAVAIKALNELWHLKLTAGQKLEIAKEIGSDVPFFVLNTPAYVTGFGENLSPIEFKQVKGILIFDGYSFDTAKIYKRFDELNAALVKDEQKFKGKIEYINDLEQAICGIEGADRVIESINDLNTLGASHSLMTGSGSCSFGIFEKDEVTKKAYDELKDKYKFVYCFSSINNSN